MEHSPAAWPADRDALYDLLTRQTASLCEGCPPLSALANAAALLWDALDDVNWAGFYLARGETLYLGPFQGKTACVVIPFGKGVCGTAAASRSVQIVPDVHRFPGHIACDSVSNAEIVLPLLVKGELVGVLDIDSPTLGRFDQADAEGLAQVCAVLTDQVDWRGGLL